MKMFKDVSVMDYNSSKVYIYSVEVDTFFDEEEQVLDFIKEQGHRLSEVSWMVSTNVEVCDDRDNNSKKDNKHENTH